MCARLLRAFSAIAPRLLKSFSFGCCVASFHATAVCFTSCIIVGAIDVPIPEMPAVVGMSPPHEPAPEDVGHHGQLDILKPRGLDLCEQTTDGGLTDDDGTRSELPSEAACEPAPTQLDPDIGFYGDQDAMEDGALAAVIPPGQAVSLSAAVKANKEKKLCNFECGRARCPNQVHCEDCHGKVTLAARHAHRAGVQEEKLFKDLRSVGGATFKKVVMNYAEGCLGFGKGARSKPFDWMMYQREVSTGTHVHRSSLGVDVSASLLQLQKSESWQGCCGCGRRV